MKMPKKLFNVTAQVRNSDEMWKKLEDSEDLAVAHRDAFDIKNIQLLHNLKAVRGGILSGSQKILALSGFGPNPLPVKLKSKEKKDFPKTKVPKMLNLKNSKSFDDIPPPTSGGARSEFEFIYIPDLVILPPILVEIISQGNLKNAEEIAHESIRKAISMDEDEYSIQRDIAKVKNAPVRNDGDESVNSLDSTWDETDFKNKFIGKSLESISLHLQ